MMLPIKPIDHRRSRTRIGGSSLPSMPLLASLLAASKVMLLLMIGDGNMLADLGICGGSGGLPVLVVVDAADAPLDARRYNLILDPRFAHHVHTVWIRCENEHSHATSSPLG